MAMRCFRYPRAPGRLIDEKRDGHAVCSVHVHEHNTFALLTLLLSSCRSTTMRFAAPCTIALASTVGRARTEGYKKFACVPLCGDTLAFSSQMEVIHKVNARMLECRSSYLEGQCELRGLIASDMARPCQVMDSEQPPGWTT